MNMRRNRFEVDRDNGKLAGVCAGIATMTGLDATIVRIAFVLAAVLVTPWVLLGYGVLALVGRPRAQSGYALTRAPDRDEARERMRNMDLRMQAIETYVTSSNSKLAREIEELR